MSSFSEKLRLSFFVYMLADPGTVFLFKSASTLIVAAIQSICVGKAFSGDQWRAMALQACGMIIVQYDPCKQRPVYSPLAYLCMVASAAVSAISAARNEYLVRNYNICLNVQNATLYMGGVWMNLFAFLALPNPNNTQSAIGFFDGYDDPRAVGVILSNALIGIVVTAVYKYADAITKCIASDITAVLLCIISVFVFELKSSVTLWCGVAVVCFAVHLYSGVSKPRTPPPKTTPGMVADDANSQDDAPEGCVPDAGNRARKGRTQVDATSWNSYLHALLLAKPINIVVCFILAAGVTAYWYASAHDAGLLPTSALGVRPAVQAVDCVRELLHEADRAQTTMLTTDAVQQCMDNPLVSTGPT